MNYHLICVHPFGVYARGQQITDPDEVANLLSDRDHHFVKIAAPEPEVVAEPEPEPMSVKPGKAK